MSYPLLDRVHEGGGVKSLKPSEITPLCQELRDRINEVVRENGGHLGPNLGSVEIIVACHRVFNLKVDRLVFDVGHQVYPHKLLSGRHQNFHTLRQKNGVSGYPFKEESVSDVFRSGHASTAISTSLGLKRGFEIKKKNDERELLQRLGNLEKKAEVEKKASISASSQKSAQKNLANDGLQKGDVFLTEADHKKKKWRKEKKKLQPEKYVVALVGDGSLTGGMAFEGLNHSGELGDRIIIILNDNSMSISPTVGGLAKTSKLFRHSHLYNRLRDNVLKTVKRIPMVGSGINTLARNLLTEARNFVTPAHLFTAFGLEYFGPVDGNNEEEMEAILKLAKKRKRAVLIHALTKKGFGYRPEGRNTPSIIGPHALSPGQRKKEEIAKKKQSDKKIIPVNKGKKAESYSKCAVSALIKIAKKQSNIVAVTAAMPDGTGLSDFGKVFPDRYFDVGICEAHAVGFSAGLCASGLKPVFFVYSTFFQRGFDQVFHEIVLQQDLAVVFCIDRAGLVGDDGPSHHGSYDIAYLRIFPNIIVMAPADDKELEKMIPFSLKQKVAVAMRYPRSQTAKIYGEASLPKTCPPIKLGVSETLRKGKKVCILAYGSMVEIANEACEILKKEKIYPTLINARFVKPLDGQMLKKIPQKHHTLFTIEEGVLMGGFGSAVLEWYAERGLEKLRINRWGLPDRLVEHAKRDEQLNECGLTPLKFSNAIRKAYKEK